MPVHRRGRRGETVFIDVIIGARDDRRRHSLHVRSHRREILGGVAVGQREDFTHWELLTRAALGFGPAWWPGPKSR
jgi:hypothetical protein